MTTHSSEHRAQRLNPFAILWDACVNAVRRCWWLVLLSVPVLVLFSFVSTYFTIWMTQPDYIYLIPYQLNLLLTPLLGVPIDSLAAAIPFLWAICRITLTADERRLKGMVAVARLCSTWFQIAFLILILSLLITPTIIIASYVNILNVPVEFWDLVTFTLYLPALLWISSMFAAACPIMVTEGCHLWAALKRSTRLSRGHRLRIAACLLIFWILFVATDQAAGVSIYDTELGGVLEQNYYFNEMISALLKSVWNVLQGAVVAIIFVRLCGIEKADERQISIFD